MSVDFFINSTESFNINMSNVNASAFMDALNIPLDTHEVDPHVLAEIIEDTSPQTVIDCGHYFCNVRTRSLEHYEIVVTRMRELMNLAQVAMKNGEKILIG